MLINRLCFTIGVLFFCINTQQAVAQHLYEMISPGGGGRILTSAVQSNNTSVMIFGTDVGGVFRTVDGGETYEKLSNGLTTKQIYDSYIALDAQSNPVIFLGTSDGVYLSNNLGDTWSLKDNGFISEPYNFTHPVYSVRSAPNNINIVWATIGEGISAEYRADDSNTVYKSINGGETWTSVLHIPISSDPEIGPLTARVVIHPSDENNVFIASNRGLYATYDGGNSWYELGKDEIYILIDGEWEQCTTVLCNEEIMNRTRCTEVDCQPLPITTYVGATHATLSNMAVHITPTGETHLLATLDDFGHMGMSTSCNGKFNDINLTRVTGGPYRSTDGGLTWTYLFKKFPDPEQELDHFLRCNEGLSRAWNGTYYNHIAVNPADSNHIFITATFLSAGIIEYFDGAWNHHSKTGKCGADSCFEGGTTQGLWANQAGPTVHDFDILDWGVSRPSFIFTHSRGAIQGEYNNLLAAYEFDHLDSDPVPNSTDFWTGTGLTDYCALDMAIDTTGSMLFVSGQDSGVVVSEDAGTAWKLTDGEANNDDVSLAIVLDEVSGIVYASRALDSNAGSHNVSYQNPVDSSWTTIGGYCGENCTNLDNGLPNNLKVYDLELDYSTSAVARGLFAGTEEGLYRYDPTAAAGSQWSQVNASGCPSLLPTSKRSVKRVRTRSDYPGSVFFSAISADTNRIKNGVDPDSSAGIFVFRSDEAIPVCLNLNNSSTGREVRAPHDFVFATNTTGQDVIVAAGQLNWGPAVFQSPINMDELSGIDWEVTVNYNQLNVLPDVEIGSLANFNNKEFNLSVDPVNLSRVLVGVGAAPYFDFYAHTQVYISENAGELNSFRVANELIGLPDKDLQFMRFSASGNELYLAPKCGGLYRMTNPFIDSDEDGLTDFVELQNGTDPNNPDTDNDGLVDGSDGFILITALPGGVDANNDGFVDGEQDFGTIPTNNDSDGDGIFDGDEISLYGTNPIFSNIGDIGPKDSPDNQINLGDLVILIRLVTETLQPTILESTLGDINRDGQLNAADILLLQQSVLFSTTP